MAGVRRAEAWRFIVLLGLVSLMADVTYEGARSLIGPYLAVLGASAAVVGALGGIGELIGYGLRPLAGYLVDRLRRPWALTIAGYAVSVFAVPLLALARTWPAAAALILAERLGKALRTPARDTMLSYAAAEVGAGKGFGLHEALDQIGAVGGPLLMAALLGLTGRYDLAFAALFVPALITIGVLGAARTRYPAPARFEAAGAAAPAGALGLRRPAFRRYLAFVALSVAGLAPFSLIAFHVKREALLPDPAIPALYAAAMLVDAAAGLALGMLYDRVGFRALPALPLCTALLVPMAFSSHVWAVLAGAMLWGVVLGGQETIMRAAVPPLVSPEERGTAYGLFNGAYGLAWFLGSAAIGALYEAWRGGILVFVGLLELAALAALLPLLRRGPGEAIAS